MGDMSRGAGGAFKYSPENKQSSSELRSNLHRSVCVLHPLPRGFSMTLPGSASPLSGAPSIFSPEKTEEKQKNRKTRASSLCAQRSPIGLSGNIVVPYCGVSSPSLQREPPIQTSACSKMLSPSRSGARLRLFLLLLLLFFFLPHV